MRGLACFELFSDFKFTGPKHVSRRLFRGLADQQSQPKGHTFYPTSYHSESLVNFRSWDESESSLWLEFQRKLEEDKGNNR